MKKNHDYGLPPVPPDEFETERINNKTYLIWWPKGGFYKDVVDAIADFNEKESALKYGGTKFERRFRSTFSYKDKATAWKAPGEFVGWIHDCAKRYIEGAYNLDKLKKE